MYAKPQRRRLYCKSISMVVADIHILYDTYSLTEYQYFSSGSGIVIIRITSSEISALNRIADPRHLSIIL